MTLITTYILLTPLATCSLLRLRVFATEMLVCPLDGCCKGSRPALPIHHTTVVLRCSYPAAVHRPSTGVYIYLGGHHWTWGYNHSSVLVFKVRRHLYNLTNGFGSFVLILRVCVSTLLVYCSAPLLYPPLTEYTIPPWLGTNL